MPKISSMLGTCDSIEKKDTNIHEISCHFLLHHKQKQHATIFSAFHSMHLNSDEGVCDWQWWLQARVFEHPAWCTRADRRETELNPKLSIWVGSYCGKGIPPVELLHSLGKFMIFLKSQNQFILF